jgi:hypothetical protein
MTFLSAQFDRPVTGRFNRKPHLSIWYADGKGWRATVAGVFCEGHHSTPEEAVVSAFDNAEYLEQRRAGNVHEANPSRDGASTA